MRSLLIFVVTFVVIGGGFFVYYALQTESAPGDATAGAGATAGAPTTLPADAPPPPEMAEGATVAGPGKDVWIKSFDERMPVTFQFPTSRHDPRPPGPVHVTDPQAESSTRTR